MIPGGVEVFDELIDVGISVVFFIDGVGLEEDGRGMNGSVVVGIGWVVVFGCSLGMCSDVGELRGHGVVGGTGLQRVLGALWGYE